MTNKPAYPGRERLDVANAAFRRAVARLHREAVRHDQALLAPLEALVTEAAETLGRLAADASAAEASSQRHQKALKAQEDKLRATLRRAARRGSPFAEQQLQRLDERAARRGPADA
ncbi:hypothetical protein [Streptomyces sp. NRRL F-5527]|uniref:hypothetical protein n=1 Tax=Streptomyces TaxID=1883 RepID=UPI0004C4DCC2|nr:hypothetical protein [Streptomyces sp. NRRL F-5527]